MTFIPKMQSTGGLCRQLQLILLALLIATTAVAYLPAFRMGLTTDDYTEVGARHFDALDSLYGQNWGVWLTRFAQRSFIDPVTEAPIFRPARQWLFWSDYLMWQMDPQGYHLTNLILHLLTSFLVGLIAWRMTRDIKALFFGGLLFATQSIHAGAVAGISSRGHVMAGLFVAMSVLFYMLPRRPITVALSILGYILALGSKETAIMLPGLLLLYEGISGQLNRNRIRDVLVRQIPFVIVLIAYLAARQLTTNGIANSPIPLGHWDLITQAEAYSGYLLDPFLNGLDFSATVPAVAACLLALLLYGGRPLIWFGLLWVPISLLVTVNFFPQDRYYYTPSIGPALVLASILASPFPAPAPWLNALLRLRLKRREAPFGGAGLKTRQIALRNTSTLLGIAVASLLAANYCVASYSLIGDYARAGDATRRILHQVHLAFPSFPSNSQIFFVGLPRMVGRGYAFGNSRQLEYALQLQYEDRSLQTAMGDHFPYVVPDLAKTFFLEYDAGKITERTDLVQALGTRRTCPDIPGGAIAWDFVSDAGGWEPWNDITGLQISGGTLAMRVTGPDPNLASPLVQVPWEKLGQIEIRMAVRASAPTVNASLYWQNQDMEDFSPVFNKRWNVQADGEWRTYQLGLESNQATPGDISMVRLRLDPADVDSEVQIAFIRIDCKN